MGNSKFLTAIVLVAPLSIPTITHAALVGRLALTEGGTDYQAYYDTEADLTWLADANAAGITMNWADANAWVTGLSIDGVTGWRLPDTNPINGSSYDYAYNYDGSTDGGYNMSAAGTVYDGSFDSEMAYLFYSTLGNTGFYTTDGTETGCTPPDYCLTNTGLFINIQTPFTGGYWSATEHDNFVGAPAAWFFSFYDGYQGNYDITSDVLYAWAVQSGDVATVSTVPLPASIWLLGSSLIVLIGLAKRKK